MEANGFVLIPGPDMKALLKLHGASEDDLAVLESGQIHSMVPQDQIPVMHYRQVSDKCDKII